MPALSARLEDRLSRVGLHDSTLEYQRAVSSSASQAALTVVDRHGLVALNMRRLGTELGVDPDVLSANLLWLIPLIGVVALTSIAMGYAVAGLAPNPQTATNVGGTISFLMFGFSGVMFPIEALPGILPDVVPYAVPHTALIEVIRGITLNGDSLSGYGPQLLVGAGWLAAAFAVAALSYRFTQDR